MSSILPIDPDIEAQPADENLAIQRIRGLVETILRLDHPIPKKGEKPATVQRDAHPKAHGVVRATFEIAENLPRECRWGLFAGEQKSYKAWVRFSNGEKKDDREKDARGMAIKLCGVEGDKVLAHEKSTQDFVLMDFPHFFIQNASQYVSFVKRLHAGVKLRFFLRHPVLGYKAWKLQRHAVNPLAQRYFSQVPYKLGPHAVKYAARPCSPVPDDRGGNGANHLREAMKKTLDERGVAFDFLVQFQTDSKRMPVEDSTIVWDESASPWTKVATVRIDAQPFDSEAQLKFAEDLSFNPWHTLHEHAPLGSLNRVRRAVYEHIAELRHRLNRVNHREPTGDETFESPAPADAGRTEPTKISAAGADGA